MATLQQTLESLVVPTAFARIDKITDTKVLTNLYAWKSSTESLLTRLDPLDVTVLSVSELADLVYVIAPLTATAQWSSPSTRLLASVYLARIPPSDQCINVILTQKVKPLFAPTPHPRFHMSTARILPRPADVQDTYIEQPWKEHPGIDEVIRWCLLNTESSAYGIAWPLFLPPVMTLLDDYQVPYKFLGVRLVSDMLSRVPPDLLLRTGVDSLMFTSLANSLSFLGDQSTPQFIRLVVSTTLQLINLTTPSASSHSTSNNERQDLPSSALTYNPSSSQSKSLSIRFSRLSTLLSSSLLGTVIMYTPIFRPPDTFSAPDSDPFTDPEHMDVNSIDVPEASSRTLAPQKQQSFNPILVAAAHSLPSILSALGIGGARFLKGVIPVLTEWLTLPLLVATEAGNALDDNKEIFPHNVGSPLHRAPESAAVNFELHLASLSSLSVLLHTCTPRMGAWSTTIIDALARCWVQCLDVESQKTVTENSMHVLRKQLKETATQLAEVCPSVTKNEYAILLSSSGPLFEGLVGEVC